MVRDKAIFIDSDGTVIDSMNFKHYNCFGPAIIHVFGLIEYEGAILKEWNRINLFSLTRGINRFDGLYQILSFVNQNYQKIEFLQNYKKWLDTTSKKSTENLSEYIKEYNIDKLKLVVDWSNETNRLIKKFQEDVKPFASVKNALENLSKEFILIVISSANKEAIEHEWNKYELKQYVDAICTQEMGTKEVCVAKMIDQFSPSDALMIGDAMGDLKAALDNDISFYPILPRQENESWNAFINNYKTIFNQGNYRKFQDQIILDFKHTLEQSE